MGHALATNSFPVRKVPIIVMALFMLHNFLKEIDRDERYMPWVNSGPGEHREGEPFLSPETPDGYDHNFHPQDQCNIEEVAHPRVRPGQCPIRERITQALDEGCYVRPNTGDEIGARM